MERGLDLSILIRIFVILHLLYFYTEYIFDNVHEIKRNYVRDKLVVSTTKPEAVKADFSDVCTVREDGSLLIQLNSPDEKQSTMKRLVENYDIDEVKVFEPSLNDIFVEYAGTGV